MKKFYTTSTTTQKIISAVSVFFGFALIVAGTSMLSIPAGIILAGVLLLADAIYGAYLP